MEVKIVKKPRAVALLTDENGNGSHIGWHPTTEGLGGLANTALGIVIPRVVVSKVDEKGTTSPLYDQHQIIENPGTIVLVVQRDLDGTARVGLSHNFRNVAARAPRYDGPEYVQTILREGKLVEVISSLGEWRWELPRGIAPSEENGAPLEAFVLKCAKIEVLDETGMEIRNARIIGRINPNSAFFPHAQYAVMAEFGSVGERRDGVEAIGALRFFTLAEIRELCDKGELDDCFTLATLCLAGLALPA